MLTSQSVHQTMLALSLVLVAGLASAWLAERLRLPDVVVYLLAGIVLGRSGLGWLQSPGGSPGVQFIFLFGAAFILYEGGREVHLPTLRTVWPSIALLATVGVAGSTAVVAAAGIGLAHVAPEVALLLAAVLSPTDPASIIPLFRQVRVRRRLAQTVVAESAFNDATAVTLTAVVLAAFGGSPSPWWHWVLSFVTTAVGGVVVGLAVAAVAALALAGHGRLVFIGRREHEPILALLTVLIAYLAADMVGVSGFMAVFAAGLVHGNPDLLPFVPQLAEERTHLHRHVLSVTGHLMRIAIFVLLGSAVDLQTLQGQFGTAALLTATLVLVARPASVLVSVLPDRRARWSWREIALFCWVRESGVVSAALVGILSNHGVPGGALMSSTVLLAVLVTLVGQASATPAVTRWLGLNSVARRS